MPTLRRLILAGLVTFIAGLIVLFPARVVIGMVDVPGIALAGIEGSVWRGSARDVAVGDVYIRDLSWKLSPLRLLTGTLKLDIEAKPPDGYVEGGVAISTGGRLETRDLRFSIPLPLVADVANVPGLNGIATGSFERIVLEDGVPVVADGSVEVANLLLPLVSRTSIGGYRAEVFTREDGLAGSVEDTDGVIDIAGSVEVRADRTYTFLGQVAPKPETPSKIQQQMQFLGTPNDRGQYELRLEGQL